MAAKRHRSPAPVPTCGKARRVFVVGGAAYVLGLRSLLVLDVGDPAAPRRVREYRLVALPRAARLAEPGGCSAFYDAADLLCDLSGACGWWGRLPAAEEGNRLFVNLLDGTYVIDFASGPEPVLRGPIPTGVVRRMRVEEGFLYVNGLGPRATLYAESGGAWRAAGEHDVADWVDGVIEDGRFSLRRRPGRLVVGTRQ